MRYSHLEIVQLILSAMDSDEVNSISDTIESQQVSNLVRSVFYDAATDLGLPEHEALFELEASGDTDQPVLMTIPQNVTRMLWLKYNHKAADETHANYVDLTYVPFEEFFEEQRSLREGETADVGQMSFTSNGETFELMYKKTDMPLRYTTLRNKYVLFNSYDNTVDTTLAKAKTMAAGSVYPVYTLSDTFTPELDPTQFSYLINKAKARAFAELKQAPNVEAAGEARRQKIIIQKRSRRSPDIPDIERLPRYGRLRTGVVNMDIPRRLKQGT